MSDITVRLGNRNRARPTWDGGILIGLCVEIDRDTPTKLRGEVLAHELIHVCQFLSGAINPGARFARDGQDESWAYAGSERWYNLWKEHFDRRVEELWETGNANLRITPALQIQFLKEWNFLFLEEYGPLTNW